MVVVGGSGGTRVVVVGGSGGQQKNFEPVRQGWPSPLRSALSVLKSFGHFAMQNGAVPAQKQPAPRA